MTSSNLQSKKYIFGQTNMVQANLNNFNSQSKMNRNVTTKAMSTDNFSSDFSVSRSTSFPVQTNYQDTNFGSRKSYSNGSLLTRAVVNRRRARGSLMTMNGTAVESDVPDMDKRITMNLLLVGSLSLSVGALGGGFIYFFVPPSSGGGSGGQVAKDRNGNEVTLKGWMPTHKEEGDRELVQGLKGDATYLVTEGFGIRDYGINAVCTHLGCVVPWNAA
jgi:hypothetical protein